MGDSGILCATVTFYESYNCSRHDTRFLESPRRSRPAFADGQQNEWLQREANVRCLVLGGCRRRLPRSHSDWLGGEPGRI
jgi:hypothetical protein